uniref:hypothetical protein n=1 Tax=Alloprevotella sp. TaxID=1872471 RepID=UPI00402914EA
MFTIALHYKNSHNAVEALIKFAPSVVVHRPVEARPLTSGSTSTGQWKHVYWPVETRPQASERQQKVRF